MARAKFAENIALCRQFINQDGKLSFPCSNPEARRLSSWIRKQSKRENLSPEEKMLLDQLRPHMRRIQDENEENWKMLFNRLVQYRQKYHTFVISDKDEANKRLLNWTVRQKKLEQQGRLSWERREALECIGFKFAKPKQSNCKGERFTPKQKELWNERFQELVEFKKEFGHFRMNYGDKRHLRLCRWVNLQRATYAAGQMDLTRKERLNSIGFQLCTREDNSGTQTE